MSPKGTEKAKTKKPAGEKKSRKPRGPATYAPTVDYADAQGRLEELANNLAEHVETGKTPTMTTFKVLLSRINGMEKTINKITTVKERGQKTLEKSLARLNVSREERGLPAMTMDEFLRA